MSPGPGRLLARGASADIFAWGERHVVKLYHDGAETAAREAAQCRAARAAGAAAPVVLDVVDVDGRAGIVFELADGPTLLDALDHEPLAALADRFAALHADVHSRRVTGLPSQRTRFASKIERGAGLGDDARRALLDTLAALPDGDALCHGDFHPKNVVLTATGDVVVDWANATLGDPHGDVARTLVLIEHGVSSTKPSISADARRAFAMAYLTHYAGLRPIDPSRLGTWRMAAAAARLSERITAEERAVLVALVDDWRAGR